MIGAGLVGRACAWQLLHRGHRVLLVDPLPLDADHGCDPPPDTGSWAALGVLMAQVFHRSSGRAWRLRQRSLELWGQWRQQLAERGHPLPWRPGLLLLASSPDELERQQRLVAERQAMGLPLELWNPQQLEALAPALPPAALGGLFSPQDGQLDPAPVLEALLRDGLERGLQTCRDSAMRLERNPTGWTVQTRGGQALQAEAVVLCAGVASATLLEPLGYERGLEPVLGQALELTLAAPSGWADPEAQHWPGAVAWQGLNLVPRPHNRLWLGATLEPGDRPDPTALASMRNLNGRAPNWLQQAKVIRQWQGHRPHPIGRPAPLLEKLEPGLLLASGHYRNGVLLAPATAEWVANQLEGPDVERLTKP